MDKIEVSQRARDAYLSMSMLPEFDAIDVREGRWDKTTGIQTFARFERDILATRTDATPVAWMPIDSAPKDGTRFLAWCPDAGRVIMRIDGVHRETWAIDPSGRLGCDPTLWQPLPAAPDHIEEPRAMVPATDVGALVEAAKASAEGWANAVELDLLPLQHQQTANDLQRQLRQALAPFTKGQNDE